MKKIRILTAGPPWSCSYCGTFTTEGLKTACEDGRLLIEQESGKKKFVKKVEHITA